MDNDSLYRHFNNWWLFRDEFLEWSVALIEEFKIGKKLIMLSDLTLQELELARDEVSGKVREIPRKYQITIGVTDETIELAETYIKEGALTIKSYNDACILLSRH